MAEAFFSNRASRILPSASVCASSLAAELRAQGRDIISLTVGEPDCGSPKHVIEAAAAAASQGQTHYTPPAGLPVLKAAIVGKFRRDNKIRTTPDQVMAAAGAKQIIFTALSATLDAGDEVIIPSPYWVSYPDMVRFHGGEPIIVECPAAAGFKLSAEQLERSISCRTKWLILNSPNNPTGAVYSEDEQRVLIEVLKRYPHVWLMTDEIYEHFVYDRAGAVSPAGLDPEIGARCLTVNGVSKAYAMTGWRIGFATGPASLIGEMSKIISQVTSCPSSVGQLAAVAALQGDQEFVREMAEEYRARRDLMVAGLNKAEGISCSAPAGAFYVYADVSGLIGRIAPDGNEIGNDLQVAEFLINHADVSTIAGAAFGLSPYIRCSFATSRELIENACARIAAACARLKPETN